MKRKSLHTHSMLPRNYRQDDNYLEYFPETFPIEGDLDLLTQPSTNIRNQVHNYTLEVALQGCNKEDIQVDMNDGKLFIRAFTGKSITDEDEVTRKEPYRGIQTRTFVLPPDIDNQHILTHYNNGVLKITLLKVNTYPSLN